MWWSFLSERKVVSRLRDMEYSPTRRLASMSAQMKDVISLAGGDPDFDTPAHVKEAAIRALQEGYTHYTPTRGFIELRKAISDYYSKYGLKADPNTEIMVTPGSQQALSVVMESLLNPGDEVLVPDPSYFVYGPQIRFLDGRPVPYRLDERRGCHIDIDHLKAHVTPRTKLLLICNPNNPTGTVFTREELQEIASVAIKHDLLVVADEIYNEFIWGGRNHSAMATIAGMRERTIVIQSFSKTFAMTGWRLGYIIAPSAFIDQMEKLQGNSALCPNASVQMAGIAALTGPWKPIAEMASEYERRIDYMAKRLSEHPGVSCPKSEGTFYVFPKIPALSREFSDRLLKEEKVTVVAGVDFGDEGEGHIRIPVTKPIEVLEKAAQKIGALASRMR